VSKPAPHPLGAGTASAPVGRAAAPPEARLQRASELDATQSPHVKSRSQENSSYPQRQAVEDGEVRWEVPFPGYAPTEWTHDTVFANSRELNTGDGWADPPRVSRAELAGRKTYAFDGQTEAVGKVLHGDRPLNPMGRTGLCGRGLLGKWGPNHAADPIVTRYDDDGRLQVIVIQRRDTEQWALPGGMVDEGESLSAAVKREFKEEAGNLEGEAKELFEKQTKELFAGGRQVFRGYTDDPRNTDNAWTETTAVHFHCSKELGNQLRLASGDDAQAVKWLHVDEQGRASQAWRELYGGHRNLIERAARRLELFDWRAAHDTGWSVLGWLRSLNLLDIVGEALQDPSGDDPFAYLRSLSRERLDRMLQAAQLGGLATPIWKALEELRGQKAATGAELNEKFKQEASFEMSYGSIELYYGGLEGLIGPPTMVNKSLLKGMEAEHCSRDRSRAKFTSSNGMTTTPAEEWEFVAEPNSARVYAEREGFREDYMCRKPVPYNELLQMMRTKNEELKTHGQTALVEEEVVAGRLYTGPCYELYNTVLRAKSPNLHLNQKQKDLNGDNDFPTTIHGINSCVIKLSKLTKATKVYRGFSSATLPPKFWEPNAFGTCGGVEFAFASTTTNISQAMEYAQGAASTIFEMQMGMVDRGADVAWLSQYPHEKEVLMPPLTAIEALGTRVEGGILVVDARLSLNLLALTLDQVVSKRRKVVQDMSEQLKLGLTNKICRSAKQDWDAFFASTGKTREGVEAFLSEWLHSISSREPELYNEDAMLGGAINGAVRAASCVESWAIPGPVSSISDQRCSPEAAAELYAQAALQQFLGQGRHFLVDAGSGYTEVFEYIQGPDGMPVLLHSLPLRMPDGKSLALDDVIKDGSKNAFENFLQLLAEALRSFGAGSEASRKALCIKPAVHDAVFLGATGGVRTIRDRDEAGAAQVDAFARFCRLTWPKVVDGTLSFQIVESVNEARWEWTAAMAFFGRAFEEQGHDCVQLLAAGGVSAQVCIRGMSTAEAGTPPVSMPLGSLEAQRGFLADVAAGKATRAALDDGLSPDAADAAGRAASDAILAGKRDNEAAAIGQEAGKAAQMASSSPQALDARLKSLGSARLSASEATGQGDGGGLAGSSLGEAAPRWPSMEGSYARLRRLIDAHGPLLLPFAPIRGGVLAMSSFADVAELGFAERWLSVEELRPLVRQTLDELLKQEGAGWDKAVEKWGEHRFWAEFPERLWSIGAAGLLRLSALLNTPGLFDPSAQLYFADTPPPPPEGTAPLKLTWPLGKHLSDLQLRQEREQVLAAGSSLLAARTRVEELTPPGNPNSRTGYLRPLRDCIGDPPDEFRTGWKEEWVALRAEQYLRFTEGLGREERGTKEWVERHKPLPKVLQRFDSAIQESVASGMEREHAETYHALQSVKGALGAAMREGRKDFACSAYALCDALHATFRKQQQDWQQKQAVRAAVEGDFDGPPAASGLPPPLYTNLEGKYGLQEGDVRWRNLRAPDEAGFRGLLSETLVRANDRVDCFSEEGYRVLADGEFVVVDGPIVCFEAAESDLQGDHSPVIIKQITFEPEPLSRRASLSLRQQTSGAFPPNTLFRLKEIKPAGSWLAPDGETRPGVDLLVVTATFKALSVASIGANGGKMADHEIWLQYAAQKAFIEGLDDIIARPLLTLEQEFTRDYEWTDFKGASYTLREEWEYVNGPAFPSTDKTPGGTRDKDNGGVTLQQFCDRINDHIANRRVELKRVDPYALMPSEVNAFLTREEVLAVRLYSGPAYQVVNNFLRAMGKLSEISSYTMGGFRRMLAAQPDVTYTATVSHLCRAIRKLSAITLPEEAELPLYRFVRGELPDSFWVRAELGLICATDPAFMTTSRNRSITSQYMSEAGPNVLWSLRPSRETDTGFHHGADISLLSQFAGENEVLFPPCTMLQVIEAADSEAQDSEAQDSEASDFPPTEQGSAPRKARPTLARQLSTWVEETVVGKLNEPKVGFYEIRVLPTFV